MLRIIYLIQESAIFDPLNAKLRAFPTSPTERLQEV